jgi:glutamate--cysteine ligase
MRAIHQFIYAKVKDELLWGTSMPCIVNPDESIPIAEYGSSNVGQMKHVYRRGLAMRYGHAIN